MVRSGFHGLLLDVAIDEGWRVIARWHMVGRTGVMWVLAASALWLSACGRAPEPEKSSPPDTTATAQPAPPAVQQITLHVPGMIDRQGIT
jgi:hypothetical protein